MAEFLIYLTTDNRNGTQILHFSRNQTENDELLCLSGSLSSGSGAEDAGLFDYSGSERRNSFVFNERKLPQ